jgi:hypothetical protein
LSQVHHFIWKLLNDEQFRQLALADTNAALGQFQLSATEQSSLHRLCLRLSAFEGPKMQFGLARYWSPW